MADLHGFMNVTRQEAERRPVEERVQDWKEVYPGGPGHALLPIITDQASRCMDCGVPFCHTGCPLGNLIPDWNDLIWRDEWREALSCLQTTNNFQSSPVDCAPLHARRRVSKGLTASR